MVGWLVGDLSGFFCLSGSTSNLVHISKKNTKREAAGVAGCLKIIPER